ncbi:MAG: nuclear transport factor 2 family protein [Rhizomicrobium sp.]
MNILPLLAAMTAAIPGWVAPDYKDLPPDLAKAALDYDEAQLRNDGQELNRLLADDYRLVARGGVVLDKKKFVVASTDPNVKLMPFIIEQPLHTVWSDGAVLGGKVNYRTIDHGKDSADMLLFADVWAKRGGTWRVVYTQVSAAK